MWKFSYSFRIIAIFYFINWIVAVETIEGGELFKGGNYSRKYGILCLSYFITTVAKNDYKKAQISFEILKLADLALTALSNSTPI